MSETKTNYEIAGNGTAEETKTKVPKWLEAKLFEEVLQKTVNGFREIKNFKAYPAVAAGENYATVMLRIEIDVLLENDNTKTVTYMLKTPHDTEIFKQMMQGFNIFEHEIGMYVDIVPEMEQMYRNAGLNIKFGATCYQLNTEHYNVLLEDLRPYGFKNTNRLEGLDMEHIKCVLKKLSQWHAASATRVATKGNYPDVYTRGYFKEESKEMIAKMQEGIHKIFFECMQEYEGHEVYIDAVENFLPGMIDVIFKGGQIDPNEFNVLNHGDCWSNNIMFQYDAFGKIKETYMVDFQVPKFGSPAQDLFYFIISSTKLELKLECFDYFIKFYHDNLVEHLNLLKYPKKLPTLRDIHIALYKHGIWGYSTATGVMAAVLLDPNEGANIENFILDNEAGVTFKKLMFSNARYRKHIEVILPWLFNRGVFE